MGVLEHCGYNMAKHAVKALTTSFPYAEPPPSEAEGIKCYGLAPWFTDTNLVRESTIGSWDYRGHKVDSMQVIIQLLGDIFCFCFDSGRLVY